MMKVFIIESSYPRDFYLKSLDGASVQGLLNNLRIRNDIRMAIDRSHFRWALGAAARWKASVLHISCHGDENGIALADDYRMTWDELSGVFDAYKFCPEALVMSSCCGASRGIGSSFASRQNRPKIIFGSQDKRFYGEYAVAWSILYNLFNVKGVNREVAQLALKQINVVVNPTFVYRRWDEQLMNYRLYPPANTYYEIQGRVKQKHHPARPKPRVAS